MPFNRLHVYGCNVSESQMVELRLFYPTGLLDSFSFVQGRQKSQGEQKQPLTNGSSGSPIDPAPAEPLRWSKKRN